MPLHAEEFTINTTGQLIAKASAGGSASRPNNVLVKVTAGTAYLGGAAGDALVPVTTSDAPILVSLVGGEQLYAKTTSGTATLYTLQSGDY